MKLGIMQPYFFPYLGYWQLMNTVDTYVIFDDVAYIKRGWINRNRIKINGEARPICLPVRDASQNRTIQMHKLALDKKTKARLCRSLDLAYRRAPYHAEVMQLFSGVLDTPTDSLSELLCRGIRDTADYLGIRTRFLLSSELEKDTSKRGQDKILDLCTRLGATAYYNAIGGKKLYDAQAFRERGIALRFVRMEDDIRYAQGSGPFLPGLSILDVMMYNSREALRALLARYTLEEIE